MNCWLKCILWHTNKKYVYIKQLKHNNTTLAEWFWGFQTSRVPTIASSNHKLKSQHRRIPWQRLLMCALSIMHHWITNKMHIISKSTGDNSQSLEHLKWSLKLLCGHHTVSQNVFFFFDTLTRWDSLSTPTVNFFKCPIRTYIFISTPVAMWMALILLHSRMLLLLKSTCALTPREAKTRSFQVVNFTHKVQRIHI